MITRTAIKKALYWSYDVGWRLVDIGNRDGDSLSVDATLAV
jgi:hypothetical protein